MMKFRLRRTVPRVSEVCTEGVCRVFSDLVESVLRTLIDELLNQVCFTSKKGNKKIQGLACSSVVGNQAGMPSLNIVVGSHSLLVKCPQPRAPHSIVQPR